MKKILALMLCVIMLLSVVACATNNNKNPVKKAEEKVEDAVDKNKTGTTGNNVTGNTGANVNNEEQTLTGKAKGYGGDVDVTVKVKGKDIISVQAVGPKETQGVGSKAIDQLPKKIEDADSTNVEVVSGATITSTAIKDAVNEALKGQK